MGIDTSSLDALAGLDDLNFGGLMEKTKSTRTVQIENSGKPLSLPIELVYEDENNIRGADNEGFTKESIAELAGQIQESNGIKSPISIRSADKDGRHKINHGARRYRAAIVAGLKHIPAFIDDEHDDYDQAVENIQRAELEPMEIALFINKREEAGDKVGAIAKRLGKSSGYISKHKALLGLPMFLAELYANGYKNTECLYEMQRACKKHESDIEALVETEGVENLNLTKIRAFVADLSAPQEATKQPQQANAGDSEEKSYQEESEENFAASGAPESEPVASGTKVESPGLSKEKTVDPDKMKKTIVLVEHDGRAARLMLEKRPAIGYAWIKNEDDGHETEVDLSQLKLTSLIEGA